MIRRKSKKKAPANNLSSPRIVIISKEDDAHIPFVTKHLSKEQFIILDPLSSLSGDELTYRFRGEETETIYQGILLNQIESVWFRKPLLPKKKDLPVPEGFKDYSYDAIVTHMQGVYYRFRKARWMSDYYAIMQANDKLSQLNLAHKLGFLVPDAIVTSYKKAAEEFLHIYPQSIMKPLSRYGYPINYKSGERTWDFFFATKIHRKNPVDLSNLDLAPTIFQQAVENIVGDIRVTVIGSKVFAAIITNPGFDEEKYKIRDWRAGHEAGTIKIEAFDELPKDIADLCVAHVRDQGLTFGALDLVLDEQSKYWFLENNPNGQWAFVEEETKQPIGAEIAHFLLHGKNK